MSKESVSFMKNKFKFFYFFSFLEGVSPFFLWGMLFCVIFTILWGADRSIGLADEGLYLLGARFPEEIQQSVSAAYIYNNRFFRLASYDPATFRLNGLLLVLVSSIVLWFGFCHFLSAQFQLSNDSKFWRLASLAFVMLGALLIYQWFYLTPNYNTLISNSIYLSAGFLLLGFSMLSDSFFKKKRVLSCFFSSGLFVGLAILTKFPSGLCMLFLYVTAIFFLNGIGLYKKSLTILALLLGVGLWFLIHFVFFQPPWVWLKLINEGWELYQSFGQHTMHSKFGAYSYELILFAFSAVKVFLPSYLVLLACWMIFRQKKFSFRIQQRVLFFTHIIALLFGVVFSLKDGLFIENRTLANPIPFYLVLHFAWISLLFTLLVTRQVANSTADVLSLSLYRNLYIALGLLVALPIVGSVGTANSIYNNFLCYGASWFCAILLLLKLYGNRFSGGQWFKSFTILCVGTVATTQIILGYLFVPQGISRNLLSQVEVVEVGYPSKLLKVDLQTQHLINGLRALAEANGFKKGGDIVAFTYIPGLVYALGGVSPGHPVFMAGAFGHIDKEQVEDYTRIALKYADLARLQKAFILLSIDPAVVEPLLVDRGLDFPRGYIKLGELAEGGYNFSIWKPSPIK